MLTCMISKRFANIVCTLMIGNLWEIPNWHALQRFGTICGLKTLFMLCKICYRITKWGYPSQSCHNYPLSPALLQTMFLRTEG